MVAGVLMVGLSRRCEFCVVGGAANLDMACPSLGAGVSTLGGDERGFVMRERL
jgi:hypothetical protein